MCDNHNNNNNNTKKPRLPFIRKKRNAERIVLMYGVFPYVERNIPLQERHPITFTATEREALLVINRLTYVKHYTHYKMWCDIRNKAAGEGEPSWKEYMDSVLASQDDLSADQYTIIELYYKMEDIVSFFRSFVECDPLVLPFETNQELYLYIKNLTKQNEKSMEDEIATMTPMLDQIYRSGDSETKERINEAIDSVSMDLWGHAHKGICESSDE